MSVLRVDAIRDNGGGYNDVVTFANNGGTENGKLCRAFTNFNGDGAVAIRLSFNVNSITDQGLGDYTVNFSNSLSDGNYVVTGTTIDANATQATYVTSRDTSTNLSGSHRAYVWNYAGYPVDPPGVCVAYFR